MKIGIQGAIGSFSEEASKKFIENHGIKNPEIKFKCQKHQSKD